MKVKYTIHKSGRHLNLFNAQLFDSLIIEYQSH